VYNVLCHAPATGDADACRAAADVALAVLRRQAAPAREAFVRASTSHAQSAMAATARPMHRWLGPCKLAKALLLDVRAAALP
jgi:hypothetical protein